MKIRKTVLFRSLLFLLLILGMGSLISYNGKNMSGSMNKSSNVEVKKIYVCSMHPNVEQDMEGECPICGMSLIERMEEKNSSDTLLSDVVLPVNESVLSTITTVNPVQDKLPLTIQASGIINFDTRKIRMISARFGGLIEKSYVKSQFQRIRKGQKIYEIYCPTIYTDHWNYIKLIQMYPDQDNLTVEAREWLKNIGLNSSQIEALKRTVKPNYHLTVYNEADGYAVRADFDSEKYFLSGNSDPSFKDIGVNEGTTIETGTPLFKVLDLKSLRADLRVKNQDIRCLRKGQKVIFTLDASSQKRYEGTVSQIEPFNGGVFQLVKVFFTDNERILLPGRQIHATIMSGKHSSIWLPETTVVNMGQHESVFVKMDNKFLATVIKTGLHNGNKVEILSGVNQNSNVALNASLLIDSDGLLR